MKNLNIVIATMLLLTAMIGIVYAASPPPPPPVPQNLGLQDISIINLTTTNTPGGQDACRECHLTTGTNTSAVNGTYNNTAGGVPTRHHKLVQRGITNPYTGATFACNDCHPSVSGGGITMDRSCLDCHAGLNYTYNSIGGHVGNITRPHHISTAYASSGIGEPAQNRTCNFCHGSFVDNYNDGHYSTFQDIANGTGYASDFMITPFASFKATNFTQPDLLSPQGGDINFSTGVLSASPTGGNKTWGGCYSCHLSNYAATPQAIGSNHQNHHNTILGLSARGGGKESQSARTLGAACSWCHVLRPGSTSPLELTLVNDFTGETLIDAMEVRNSTIEATSPFEPGTYNITVNGTGCEKCHDVKSIHNIQFNYVSGGSGTAGQGHINNNLDCYGCHNSWLPADTWVPGPLVPTVNSVDPAVIAENTATTLTITGTNFVNDPYTSVVTVDGVTYTPTSPITDSKIVVDIPALSEGTHKLQLVKGGNSLSALETLTAVPVVTISSATLSGTTLTITGSGLVSQPSTDAQQYVTFSHGGNVYSADAITSWSDTQIVATVSGAAAGDTVEVITANSGQANANIIASAPADTTPPVITVNAANPVTITQGTTYTDAGATAVDAVDGTVPVTPTGTVDTTKVGTYTITYTATDKAGNTATATRTVNVVASTPTPSITVTSPNGGDSWKRGSLHTITWTNVGSTGANVKIELLRGTSATIIASTAKNSGSYSWKVPSGQAIAANYKIRITSTTNKLYTDSSDNYFSITK